MYVITDELYDTELFLFQRNFKGYPTTLPNLIFFQYLHNIDIA